MGAKLTGDRRSLDAERLFRLPAIGSASGATRQNHFSIPDHSVSREHCVIVRQGDGFLIRDLGSHNGTLVNDLPVKDQLLAHRDYIAVGHTVLQFLTEDDVVFEDPAEPQRCPFRRIRFRC